MINENDKKIISLFVNRYSKAEALEIFQKHGGKRLSDLDSYGRHHALREMMMAVRRYDMRPSVVSDNHKKVMNVKTKDIISDVVGGSFKREAETLYWTTNDWEEIYISDMDDDHLHNTILFIDRTISSGKMAFSKNHNLPHFLSVMEDERIHRGLPMPLLPIKSLAYRRKNND